MLWLFVALLGVVVSSDSAGFLGFVVAIVIEWAFTNGPVKLLFQRERPDNTAVAPNLPPWLHPPRSSSFPSGHSSSAAFAAVIWFSWSPILGSIAVVVALAMGLSRIIIRAHHPTDVAAGLLWGAGLAALALVVAGPWLPGG